MKSLSLLLMILFLAFSNAQELDLQKQRVQSESDASKALSSLRELFTTTIETDFSDLEEVGHVIKLGGISVPRDTTKNDVLKRKIQIWVSQIDLAQDYPVTKFSGQETINQLIRGKDYFGVSISSDFEAFNQRHQMVMRLFKEPQLNMGDRLFGLMQTGKEDSKAAVKKWISFMELLSGPEYLGANFDKQTATYYKSLKGMSILSGVINSNKFQETVQATGDLNARYQQILNNQLKKAAFEFAKKRYKKGGLLRDWCLPVGETIIALYPSESRESIGIATQEDYRKYTLAHARALTELIDHLNGKSWSSKFVNRSFTSINDYRTKPFYIGSTEIRESGTLKVPKDSELELLLENAELFGPDGHVNVDRYAKHSERLDRIFIGSEGKENLEGLVALKSPEQWLDFFQIELFGDRSKTNSVFQKIESDHTITPKGLEVLFLARLILPSDSFQSKIDQLPSSGKKYSDLLAKLEVEVKKSSAQQYRNFSSSWNRVQNGYMELAKGFSSYSFERLNLTTSSKLEKVRKGFDKAMKGNESVPVLLQKLFTPNSRYLESSMEQMVSSKFRERTGRYDLRIVSEFVDVLNDSLIDIIDYRTNGYSAIDSLERSDAKEGKIMSHFAVSDYRLPTAQKSNTVIHDLICGRQGGFGGLGALFVADINEYNKRESIFDGIAAADKLKLGDILFSLALDVKREPDYTDDELGRAAKRWLDYFKQSQAGAHFSPNPRALKEAVRGAYLTRLVFQSEVFKRALKNSASAPVGSGADIDGQFEQTVSAQVSKMQGMLSRIDPETASNRNIDETKKGWFEVNVWYVESVKWLEAILGDSEMSGELSRIRDSIRKIVDYSKLAPEVVAFQNKLLHSRNQIYNHRDVPFTVGVANFGIEEVIELEAGLQSTLRSTESLEEKLTVKQREFGKTVVRDFLTEIREIVRDHGFEDLSSADDSGRLRAYKKAIQSETEGKLNKPGELRNQAKAIEDAYEAAIARAISRLEADQPSDMRSMYDQMVRASKVNKHISKDLPQNQRLEISPSLILAQWVERNRVETLANFRTRQISAEARDMVNKARAEKQSMEDVRRELESARDQSVQKIVKLKEWMKDSETDLQVSVDEMMDDYLSMQQELAELKKQNLLLADSEAIVRAQAADLAQQVMQYKHGDKIAAASQTGSPSSSYTPSSSNGNHSYNNSTSNQSYGNAASSYKPKPTTSYKPTTSTSTSSQSSSGPQSTNNKTLFQRLFKRKR